MSYGLPTEVIPVTADGITIKLKDHRKWISRRRVKEDCLLHNPRMKWDKIDLPSPQDVLLGKGKALMRHYGNQSFRNLIEDNVGEYISACTGKGSKAIVITRMMEQIHATGGRFLKKNDTNDWWEAASDHETRLKVGKAFGSMQTSFHAPKMTDTPASSDVDSSNVCIVGKRQRIDKTCCT